METLLQRLRRNFGIIVKIKPYLSPSNLISLYHTMVESKLRYCIAVWKHGKEGIVSKLQKIYDKFSSLISKSSASSIKPFLSIDDLFVMETSLFMYKLDRQLLPDYFADQFKYVSKIHNISTRNKDTFHLPFSKSLTQQ